MRKIRWGSILLAVVMLLTLLTVTALADGTVKSEVELRNAIEAETEDTTGCGISIKGGTDNTLGNTDATTADGYAVQYFENNSGITNNGYFNEIEAFKEYQTAKENDANAPFTPDVEITDAIDVALNSSDLVDKISEASDGDTIKLLAGTYTLSAPLEITKRVNLVGAGQDATTIVGNIVYQFSSDQENNTLTVRDLTVKAGSSNVQGIQFRGNQPNNGYNLKISVENCAFDGWTYALAMNSHANMYALTVKDCDFSKSLCAVNFNHDTSTTGQTANNSLNFEGQNVIAANGFAVEKFGNSSTAPGLTWYDTVANFEMALPSAAL